MAEVAPVSHVLRDPSQAELDAALEREIETARLFATQVAASDPMLSRIAFGVMRQLIKQRSPEGVARMEAKIEGLRTS